MSELIDRGGLAPKDLLKHLILQLHVGAAPAQVQRQLVRMLGQVPYGMVVEVEQELIEDGMPAEEVTKLCHLHGAALEGAIDLGEAPVAPPGHPAHTFAQENAALRAELAALADAAARLEGRPDDAPAGEVLHGVRARLNALADVEKHYLRKEHLLFPYLEKHGITGPPKVMWAKHDETRALLRGAFEALAASATATVAEARSVVALAVRPAAQAIRDMTDREENILLPMSLDTLDELEWWEIARQSADVGFCLVDPAEGWRPASLPEAAEEPQAGGRIRLPTGSLAPVELEALLNALPLDATFVDAEDRVRWFSAGRERIFGRSRAILGRKVQYCHPPSSVDTVDRILGAFRAGRRDRAAFWIQHRGRFVHIEYVALRDGAGGYLGCLEVTQDLTEKRALTGEQRLLSWSEENAPLADEGAPAPAERPPWADGAHATRTHDARAAIEAGEHPMPRVMADLASLGDGAVYALVTPFVPAPLVDLARGKGFESFSAVEGDDRVTTYFRRPATSSPPPAR